MKPELLFTLIYKNETYPIQVSREQYSSLMRLISGHLKIPGFGHCGGSGSCGTCMVEIAGRHLLSCAIDINDELANMQIVISDFQRAAILPG